MTEITRLFSSSYLETGAVLRLSEEEGHHVHKVLRGRAGERVEVVDGAGRLFVAELLGGVRPRYSRSGLQPGAAKERRSFCTRRCRRGGTWTSWWRRRPSSG